MKIIFLLASLLAIDVAFAQEQNGTENETASDDRPIEQIIVIGERNFTSLRIQIREMKDQLFATFNEINQDNDYDVDCKNISHTRSRITQHVCRPVFFDKAIAQNAQDAIGAWVPTAPPPTAPLLSENQIINEERENFEILQTLIQELAEKDEAFAESLLELGKRQLEFEYRKQTCNEKPAVLFLFRRC